MAGLEERNKEILSVLLKVQEQLRAAVATPTKKRVIMEDLTCEGHHILPWYPPAVSERLDFRLLKG